MNKTIGPAGILLSLALAGIAAPSLAAGKTGGQLTSVDVSLGDVSINKVPFLIAADTGIYAKNGLDVHQYLNPEAVGKARADGVDIPAEYMSDHIDDAPISVGGGVPMITRFIDKNAPHRVIVTTTEEIVRDHVLAQSSVASMQDLKGKRLGYSAPGTVTHYDTLAFARQMGWEPGKDITLVDKGASIKSLKEDKTDALVGSALMIALAEQSHFKDLGGLAGYKIPLAGSGVMIERKWLASHRDATARFVKASVEATALMKSDQNVFNAALAKWFNVRDKATQDRMYALAKEFPAKPYPSVAGVKEAMQMYDSPKMRTHKPAEFYDTSFIAKLDRSGYLDKLDK